MKIFAAILFCFLAISIQSCEKSNPASTSASPTKYIYQRANLARSEKVEIQSNQIDYEFVKNGGRLVGKRSDYSGLFQNLKNALSISEFRKMKDSYETDEIDSDDSFSIEIIDSENQSKKVYVEVGAQYPAQLEPLKQKLDSLIDALMY